MPIYSMLRTISEREWIYVTADSKEAAIAIAEDLDSEDSGVEITNTEAAISKVDESTVEEY